MLESLKQTSIEAKKQNLTPEQEKQLNKEKEQVLMLSKIQRASLSNESLLTYLEKYHDVDLSKYSSEIKQKFLEEIAMLFEELKDFDENMLLKLRIIRESMSFGLEEGKTNEYYRNLIIGNAIEKRISILQATIETQYGETIDIKGVKINKADFTKFQTEIQELDKKYGLNIFDSIVQKLNKAPFGGLNFNTINIQDIIKKECIKS